jgi:hypothetical protein
MKSVEIPDEEYVYAISLLVQKGWVRVGDNSWIHPLGKKCVEKTYDPISGKDVMLKEDNWTTKQAYEEVKDELDKGR